MSETTRTRDLFSSRFALILAALGMAIGSGNIWRFPRIMAKFDGGGTFLIPWAIFLFSWSVPLLIVETSIGKKTGKGVVASLGSLIGKGHTWIGAFVALCTIAIMFYYAVVAGWCGIYVVESLTGELASQNVTAATERFTSLAQGFLAGFATLLAFCAAGFFVARGIRKGVEIANKIFLPLLFVLLFLLIIVGLTRDGSGAGVGWMFSVNLEQLSGYQVWLEALSQSAWSTGAGWGLFLTLAVASSSRGNNVGDAVVTGVGNNIASLVAALATVPAVFALAPALVGTPDPVEVLRHNGPGNTGMAMVWMPRLFAQVGAIGPYLSAVFFLALTFAALTSLIAMVELSTRTLMDLGILRKTAIVLVTATGFMFCLPSAFSLDFLANQDWVWGIGLMLSGFLIVVAVGRVGYDLFRREWINDEASGSRLGSWFNLVLMVLIPVQFLSLIGWWFFQTASEGWAEKWWDPFDTYSIGTCLFQWGLAFVFLFLVNRELAVGVGEVPDATPSKAAPSGED